MSRWGKQVVLLGVAAVVGVAIVASVVPRQNGLPAAELAAAPTSVGPVAPGGGGDAGQSAQTRDAGQMVQTREAGQTDRARELEQRLADNPRDAAALAEMVDGLFAARRYAQAADLISQAIDAGAESPRLRMGLGVALFYQGMPNMARRELKRAVDLDPNLADAQFNYALALSHGSQADADAARAAWEAVVRLDPDGELGRKARDFLNQPPAAASPTGR